MKVVWRSALVAACCTLFAGEARAQLNGSNLRGDFGVGSGSQAAPGLYTSLLFVNYDTDTIRDRDGNKINSTGEISVYGIAPILTWVGKTKMAGGAAYGFMAAFPTLNNALEAPGLNIDVGTGFGVGDLYLQPMNLGWHTKRADYIAGIGLFLPTGRYDVDASDNTGLGMTTFELFGGTTVFADQARTISIATTAYWETHSEKRDSNVKVGDMLTLEGGIGKSFLGGGASVGLAYYAQWKLTSDDFGGNLANTLLAVGKHKMFALGPDVTLPIAAKGKLVALVNIRAEWDVASRSTTDGHSIIITTTFPIPSISLAPKP